MTLWKAVTETSPALLFCLEFRAWLSPGAEVSCREGGADGIRRSRYERLHRRVRETVLPLVWGTCHTEPDGTQEEVLLRQVPLGVLEIRETAQRPENRNRGDGQ